LFLVFLFVANEHVVVTGDLCVIWLTSGELAVYTDAENSSVKISCFLCAVLFVSVKCLVGIQFVCKAHEGPVDTFTLVCKPFFYFFSRRLPVYLSLQFPSVDIPFPPCRNLRPLSVNVRFCAGLCTRQPNLALVFVCILCCSSLSFGLLTCLLLLC